jgi:SAM-dependent methyltransferase
MTKLSELIDYYEARYATPPGAMRDYRRYLELMDVRPGARLLDIGCGEGFLLAEARAAGMDPLGVEISLSALRLTRESVPDVDLALAAGESLPFASESFDAVACLGTLEHFADPAAGVREMARVTRRDGQVLVVVPNRRFVGWRLLRRKGTEQQDVAELLLDLEAWKSLLEGGGLEVVKVVKEPWDTKPQPTALRRLTLKWAWRLIPLRWTYQFAILCRPS